MMKSSERPFGYDEAGPLLDALSDPVSGVRTGALRALVRLPLSEEVWLDVGRFIWRELASPASEDAHELGAGPAVPRRDLIEAATYAPIAPIRRQLHELVETGSEEDRRAAVYALARARDGAAIPQLVADLSDPDSFQRAAAAEYLAWLDVTPVKDRLRRVCLEDGDGVVRFWLALALARLGEREAIRRLLLDLDRGRADIFPLMVDGQALTDRVAGCGPFPDAVNQLLERMAADERLSDYVRQIAADLSRVSDGLPEADAAAGGDRDPALEGRAAELAAAYLAESPLDESGRLPWEETHLLAHLPAGMARRLVPALFGYVAERYPPGERFAGGNDIVQLPQEMWRSFAPDIPTLFELYATLDERDTEFRWQLAWAMSRAGVRRLLAELSPRLRDGAEAERLAVVRLIEEAIRYAKYSHGPVFGGAGAAADVTPGGGPWIELDLEEAALAKGLEEPREEAGPPEGERGALRGEEEEEEEEEAFTIVDESGVPEPRWLQGQLYEMREGGETRLERAMRAGGLHRLVVRIGAAEAGWITAPENAAFPVESLPEDQAVYELRVVLSEPHHVPQPLVDTIYLPRLRGNSTTCDFQFRARADVPEFEGRVAVMAGNRILQTMFLVAQVVPDPARAAPEAAIRLKPETAVRANLGDLDARPAVDVALVADTRSDGATHVTEIASARVALRSLENVEEPIRRIRRRLSNIADSPDDFASDLFAEATVRLLRFLARQGKLLYNGIVESQLGDHPLRSAARIQLVSARESFLPLEFMYERPSPTAEASLCPRAGEALLSGACSHCDQLEDEVAGAFICPLGFWCMSRVIERHAVRPVAETDLSGAEYALQSDPATGRDTLDVLQAAVYAASDRVHEEQIEQLLRTLAEATSQRAEYVQDWEAWRGAVQSRKPSMLVLLPHTLEDEDYIPTLEIGAEQRLPGEQITPAYVHAALDYQPPIVLLLGCETAVPDVPFQSFVVQFRIHGAAIVLSTLTPVLGRHAAPVAVMLLNELQRVAGSQGTFGDALLGLRRRALAAGIPMVLALVAYGDADWRLRGAAEGGAPGQP